MELGPVALCALDLSPPAEALAVLHSAVGRPGREMEPNALSLRDPWLVTWGHEQERECPHVGAAVPMARA